MTSIILPPNMTITDRIILFDGVCKLCNAESNFIIKHDKKHLFKLVQRSIVIVYLVSMMIVRYRVRTMKLDI
jgi:hypothetical protein